jgi:N-acyl-D-aspartate/D-glutamate deacylase
MTRSLPILIALLFSLGSPARAQEVTVDLLIRGGRLVDGTGAPERLADVGVRGDRIVFVGDATRSAVRATRVIDASGLIVSPGFIDPHAHSTEDLSRENARSNENYLMQGVTTVLTGNDGGGPTDVGPTLDRWTRQGLGTNAGLYAGHGSIRRSVLGSSAAAPTQEQLERMKGMVATAMRSGALGLSTGLYYAPGSYATTEEVIELARVAASLGGVYDTHMRDESSYTIGLIGSVHETLRIAREAGIAVHISHIKALGTDVWGQSDTVIAIIRTARASGLRVTADQYPYTASGTGLGAALLPRWAEAGGRDSLRARLSSPAMRTRIETEMRDNLRRRGGAASLLITSRGDTSIAGKNLEQIAAARRTDAISAAIEILLRGGPSVASFNMNEADIERFMAQDFVMTGSDGSGGHPRKYGTYPLKFRKYVMEKKLITLPFFVSQSAALPARTFGLAERGVIATGNFADIAVFSETEFTDRSTFEEPQLLATGAKYVLVNGALAVDGGSYTGALGGQALRGPGYPRR